VPPPCFSVSVAAYTHTQNPYLHNPTLCVLSSPLSLLVFLDFLMNNNSLAGRITEVCVMEFILLFRADITVAVWYRTSAWDIYAVVRALAGRSTDPEKAFPR